MDTRPIGIFDSGVGGLTVLTELRKKLPNENYIYIGDTKRFPYGSKSKETIIQISKRIVDTLISKKVKLIVIACGTATSQALEELKQIYNIPIIGIIEPTVENQMNEKVKKVGVIATRGTIRSKVWETTICKKNPSIAILSKETPLLAPMAEEGWIDNEVARSAIKEYMKDWKEENLDALILGCTHYPLFEKLLRKELGDTIKIINTGKEIAKSLEQYLKENDLKNEGIGTEEIYLTDTESNFLNVAKQLFHKEIKIQKIAVLN